MLALGVLVYSHADRAVAIGALPDHEKLKVQKEKVVNSRLKGGEVLYGYHTDIEVQSLANEADDMRTAHARFFQMTPDTFRADIIGGAPQYFKHTNGTWYFVEYATTTKEAFELQTSETLSEDLISYVIGMAYADDFFPDASAGDGNVGCESGAGCASVTWATTHDATAGDTERPTLATVDVAVGLESGKFVLDRIGTNFDTTTLPDAINITSATISLAEFGTINNGDNDGNDYLVVVSSNNADVTAIDLLDYDQFGTTALSDTLDIGSVTSDAYNVWTLNATGIATINLTGVSEFGLREGHDVLNDPYAGADNTTNLVSFRMSETADTSSDPKLTVTYTVAGGVGSSAEIKLGM